MEKNFILTKKEWFIGSGKKIWKSIEFKNRQKFKKKKVDWIVGRFIINAMCKIKILMGFNF